MIKIIQKAKSWLVKRFQPNQQAYLISKPFKRKVEAKYFAGQYKKKYNLPDEIEDE